MRRFAIPNVMLCGLLLCGLSLSAPAQNQPPRYDRYGASSASDFRDSQLFFARVRSDLDRAESNLPPASYAVDRFDRARGELSELQRQWDENVYQPRQADAVINALDRVLDSRDLAPRDRDRLASDLRDLRDFRDSHE